MIPILLKLDELAIIYAKVVSETVKFNFWNLLP